MEAQQTIKPSTFDPQQKSIESALKRQMILKQLQELQTEKHKLEEAIKAQRKREALGEINMGLNIDKTEEMRGKQMVKITPRQTVDKENNRQQSITPGVVLRSNKSVRQTSNTKKSMREKPVFQLLPPSSDLDSHTSSFFNNPKLSNSTLNNGKKQSNLIKVVPNLKIGQISNTQSTPSETKE